MNKKKKILLISDDIRFFSGVATQSKELILSTIHKYDFVNIAGAINHQDKGKVLDLSQEMNNITGIKDAYLKLYPVDDYGNEQILFQIIAHEKPDAIAMITDPRFFIWLFALEKQIRNMGIPIVYWNIWDQTPFPMYNRAFYESTDCLFSISKQTYNINKWVLGPENCCTIDGEFDEHGNHKLYEK